MATDSQLVRLAWRRDGMAAQVAVRVWGDGPGRDAVVCVHGLSRNARDFDELAAALAPRYRVACIDMPGRGDSQWLADPSGYNGDAYADVACHVMDRLELGRVHWVGTSMGGLLGLRLAAAIPDRIRSLVLNDVGAELDGEELGRQRRKAAEQVSFADGTQAREYLRLRYAEFGIRSEARWDHFTRTSIEPDGTGRWRLRFDPRAVPQAPARAIVPFWDAYLALRCPVRVLRGAQSRLLSVDTCERMARSGPRATWVDIAGAGHAPDLCGADRIEPITRFLEDLP